MSELHRIRLLPSWIALSCALAVTAGGPALAHDTGPTLAALSLELPIVVDGDLSDPAWSGAAVGDGFTQQEPLEGEPATEATEFRIAYTQDTLYVAIRAYDAEPHLLIAQEMERDSRLFRDDSVIITFDTFHDHRNAYFFEVNPNGATTDILIGDEGREFNPDWDGIWRAAAQVDDHGWTAEMAIPFSTLRFDPGITTWGMNMQRRIRRKNEVTFWAPMPREGGSRRISLSGHLTGLEGIEAGRSLEVRPFVTGILADDGETTSEDFDAGLDVKWGITRNHVLDLTYNTDFADVESDALQVNLTRFSLFFPEKRDFFLENAGIFSLGPGAPQLDLFFSRRIGIGPDGEAVPIDAGARVTGRVGGFNLGALAVRTGALAGIEGAIPSNDWGVIRASRNIGQRSTMGLMMTERRGEGGDDNRSFGLDANLNLTPELNVYAFAARTEDSDTPTDDAFGVTAEWQGDLWEWGLLAQEIGENFNPEIGFVRRRGVRRYGGELEFKPRPESLPWIRSFEFSLESDLVTRLDDSIESFEGEFGFLSFETESGDEFGAGSRFLIEDLVEPFEISDGIVIAPGEYRFTNHFVRLESSQGRRYGGEIGAESGEFFDGDRVALRLEAFARPSRYFRSSLTWIHNDIDLPAGSFSTNLLRSRFGVSFTPNLSISALTQYLDASELLALNLRMRWVYKPGADLFVVYNQNWDAPSVSNLTAAERQLVVKYVLLWTP